ncbi:hypothetical protein WDU94_008207 [Cyamophila willieti]
MSHARSTMKKSLASRVVTSMGALFEAQTSDPFLNGVKQLADVSLRTGWKNWRILPSQDLADLKVGRSQLRFALPTLELVKLYVPGATQISERKYGDMTATLFSWPLGQALFTNPIDFARSLRPTEDDFIMFVNGVKHLRADILSRWEVNRRLASKDAELNQLALQQDSLACQSLESSPFQEPSPCRLACSRTLKDKLKCVSELDSKSDNNFSQQILSPPHPRLMISSDGSESPLPLSSPQFTISDEPPMPSASLELRAPQAAPRDFPSHPPFTFDSFDPVILKQEPEVPDPPPRIREHLTLCQQWGNDGWNSIAYKDAEKNLKHGGGFQPLLVNHQLANKGRDDYRLREFERILGNIQYGVFAQREAFSKASVSFLATCPEMTSHFIKAFTGEQAEFRLVSQDLVQYTCGKRSEVIAQRRNQMIVPGDPGFRRLLTAIPPSETHLFCEEGLSMFSFPSPPPARTPSATHKRKMHLSRGWVEGTCSKQPKTSAPNRPSQRIPFVSRKEDKGHREHFKPSYSTGGGKHRQQRHF